MLWGEKDGIVAPSYGERLAAALPNASFEPIAAAAHYPQIEQPDAVAAAIERFAQQLNASLRERAIRPTRCIGSLRWNDGQGEWK